MMRSTPRRVFNSSCVAISSAVPFFKKPPAPQYAPSVFSRKTTKSMSSVVRSRSGVRRGSSRRTGRRLM